MAANLIVNDTGKARRTRGPGLGPKLVGAGAALAAAAAVVAAGPAAPRAAAQDIAQDVYTAGPLMGLIAGLGVDSVTVPLGTIDPIGEVNLILNLTNIAGNPRNLYDTVNALPFLRGTVPVTGVTNTYNRYLGETPRQFPATLGAGWGAGNLVEAYRAEIAAVSSGNAAVPAGYTDWERIAPAERQTLASGCTALNPNNCPQVQPIYATNQALLFLRNPLRPNGGIVSRFGPILNLFGVDTSMPAAGVYTSDPVPSSAPSGEPRNPALSLNTATVDVTWAYDILSDFPATLNPFSLLNSAFTLLPTNLLGGVELKGVDTTALGLNIAGTLGILNRLTGIAPITNGAAFYGTLQPDDLPLLEPLRAPSRILNALFGWELGTPLADALQPALEILVNTGYTDVQTPAQGGTYNRTFEQAADYVPFLSQAVLTPAEWLQVPGDVVRALIVGFQDAFPILRFGQTAPVLTVDGNHLAITYPPAAGDAQPAPAAARRPAATTAPAPAPPTPAPAPAAVEDRSAERLSATDADAAPDVDADAAPAPAAVPAARNRAASAAVGRLSDEPPRPARSAAPQRTAGQDSEAPSRSRATARAADRS